MRIRWVSGVAPIVTDLPASTAFYRDLLGLPFAGHDYPMTDAVNGIRHLGLWTLENAAQSCFGSPAWPAGIPIPQAEIEFDVDSPGTVGEAAREMEAAGHQLLQPVTTEEWGQTVCRVLSPEGFLVTIAHTPWQLPVQTGPTVAFLRGLRATRDFLPDPVPDGVIADILEVARWSGSSMNRQPWEFIVVRDPAVREALVGTGGHVDHLRSAPLGIVLVMDGVSDEDETYDEGRLAERIMLAAQAHGYGSCIGWFWPAEAGERARLALGVPEGKTVRTVVSIGRPAPAATDRPKRADARKPLEGMVHLDRYGAGE